YNVPKSISKGFEAEITWIPIDNLQLLLSYSYNDAYIKDGVALDTADPAAVEVGARPIGAPTSCAAAPAGSAPCDVFTGILQRTQTLHNATLPNAPKNKVAISATYTFREVMGGDIAASASYFCRDVQVG